MPGRESRSKVDKSRVLRLEPVDGQVEAGRAVGVELTRDGCRTAQAQAMHAVPTTGAPELEKAITHTVHWEGARRGREGIRRKTEKKGPAGRQRARGGTSCVCPMALLMISLPHSLPCQHAAPCGITTWGESGQAGQCRAGRTGENLISSTGLLLRRRLRGGDGMYAAEQVSTANLARDERRPRKHAQVHLLQSYYYSSEYIYDQIYNLKSL